MSEKPTLKEQFKENQTQIIKRKEEYYDKIIEKNHLTKTKMDIIIIILIVIMIGVIVLGLKTR